MPSVKPSSDLKLKIEQAADALAEIKRRYFLLVALQNEFLAVVRRGRVPIQNDHVWTLVFDTRDALALHLTSWSKGLAGQGGLFGQLDANRRALYVPKPKRSATHLARVIGEARREAFERSFPDAVARNRVTASDVEKLKARFLAPLARVRNDRSKTLAHLYERDAQLTRKLVTPRGYRAVFQRVEAILLDLCRVIRISDRDYGDSSVCDTDVVARDLVDLVLCGTISNVLHDFGISERLAGGDPEYYWQFRERYHDTRRRRTRGKRSGVGKR